MLRGWCCCSDALGSLLALSVSRSWIIRCAGTYDAVVFCSLPIGRGLEQLVPFKGVIQGVMLMVNQIDYNIHYSSFFLPRYSLVCALPNLSSWRQKWVISCIEMLSLRRLRSMAAVSS